MRPVLVILVVLVVLVVLSLAVQAVAGDVPTAETCALDDSSAIFVPVNGTLDLAGSRYAKGVGEAAALVGNLVPWPGAQVAIDVTGLVGDASIHAVERETARSEGDLLQVGKEAARLREIRAEGRDPRRDPEGQRILAWMVQQSRRQWDGQSYLEQSLKSHLGYTLLTDGTTLVAGKLLGGPIYRRIFKKNGLYVRVNMQWNGRHPLVAGYGKTAKMAWKAWWKGMPDAAQKGVVETVVGKAGGALTDATITPGTAPHSTLAAMAPTLSVSLASPLSPPGLSSLATLPQAPRPRIARPAAPLAPAPVAPVFLAPAPFAPAPVAPVPLAPVHLAAPGVPVEVPRPVNASDAGTTDTAADIYDDVREDRRAVVPDASETPAPPRTHTEVRTRDEWRYVPVPAGFDGDGNPQFNYVWKKFPSGRSETVTVPDAE